MASGVTVCAVQQKPLDASALLDAVRSPHAGAAVLFVGTVRDQTANGATTRETVTLRYDAYDRMATAEMRRLLEEHCQTFDLTAAAAVHRTGHLAVGDLAVVVAVSSPHRDASFEAGRSLLDAIKTSVPLWKEEHWADGTREWVHPGLSSAPESPASGVSSP